MTFKSPLRIATVVSLALFCSISVTQTALGQKRSPNFARVPRVIEYDVDLAWPKVPEHVSQEGWVSGLAVDDKDQIWFVRKGPDPAQVYMADGDFVRTSLRNTHRRAPCSRA